MANGLVEKGALIRGGHVANENTHDPAWVRQHDIGVDLEIRLAAITHEDELSFRKVAQNLLQRAAFPLCRGLEDPLKHAGILLEMERARRQSNHFEVLLQ